MRPALLFLFLFFSYAIAAQQYAYSRYEGSIANKSIVMHLHVFNRPEYEEGETSYFDQVHGTYYLLEDGVPVHFDGSILESGELQLNTFEGEAILVPIEKGHYEGSFSTTTGFEVQEMELTESYPKGSVPFVGTAMVERKALYPNKKSSPGMEISVTWLDPGKTVSKETSAFVRQAVREGMAGKDEKCCENAGAFFKTLRDEQFRMYDQELNEMAKSGTEMPEHMMNYADDHSVYVLYNSDHLLSLAFNHYFYSGGAHGNYATDTRSYDLLSHRPITLDYLFKKGYEKKLQPLLDQAARAYMDLMPSEELTDAYFVEHIPLTENFYLTNKGIVFSYPPYEIAAYAAGEIELFITISELSGFIRER